MEKHGGRIVKKTSDRRMWRRRRERAMIRKRGREWTEDKKCRIGERRAEGNE